MAAARRRIAPRSRRCVYESLLVAALVFVAGFLVLPLVSPGQAAPVHR